MHTHVYVLRRACELQTVAFSALEGLREGGLMG